MELFLIALAGAGLAGCFAATLRMDLSGRGLRDSRRLSRPRRNSLIREAA